MPRLQRAGSRAGEQRRPEEVVDVVDEGDARAAGGQGPLERASAMEAAEAASGDHDVRAHPRAPTPIPRTEKVAGASSGPFPTSGG